MPSPIAVLMLLLSLAPLVCLVDFFSSRRTARQAPSYIWALWLSVPWALLILATAAKWRALLLVAFASSLMVVAGWITRRLRTR